MPDDFRSVGEFHRKFDLDHALSGAKPHLLERNVEAFRRKFLHEELREYEEAVDAGDLPKGADALIDLVYVALGTAHLMGLPWAELFAEVQRANMAKERCTIDHVFVSCFHGVGLCTSNPDMCHLKECGRPRHEHSARGSIHDVIKPPSWRPPNIINVLMRAGWPGPPLPLEEER